MRVIAGSFKGRRLSPPTWAGLRPTSDKLRETLFNVLGARVGGARVLDAFAGTGALGIEALSRGASAVTFIESDRRAQRLIAENLARCSVSSGFDIVGGDAIEALGTLSGRVGFMPFDLVLLDPPYEWGAGGRRVEEGKRASGAWRRGTPRDLETLIVAVSAVLAPGGLVVLEHARRRPAPGRAGRLTRVRELTSGDSALSFYVSVR
jgi:16S rRNA (guanine(966)-N(2))-methyltransferase RsmD